MTSKLSKPTKVLGALALVVGLVGCEAMGPTENPFERKFQWFSYLEGEDFQNTCAALPSSRYRMVYNGVYTEQIRTYDLDGEGAMRIQVIGGENLRELELSSPSDLLNPWRGKTVNFQLDADEVTAIVDALDQDGVFGPPADGLELSSKGFFWTIAACHGGQYRFTGVTWPSAQWDALRFDDVLFDVDLSQIPVNPPRKTDLRRDLGTGVNEASDIEFHTKVGKRGLVKLSDLFQ
ncbi:hypothetical protein V5T82_13250 [Magnetovibrio sp. PR-2]|uniref:hypothetical protein n=1 Tax=Magnetovibrio sp. PR-2 TaxID=3120356 RepID=UPI002FCE08A3